MDAYGPLCDVRNPLPADAATRRILGQAPTSNRQWKHRSTHGGAGVAHLHLAYILMFILYLCTFHLQIILCVENINNVRVYLT